MAKKVYAIKEGFDSAKGEKVENVIVNTWAECLKYTKGVKGAKYKSFEDPNEAEKFLNDANDVLKKEDNNYPMDCLHIYVDGSYNIATEKYAYGLAAVRNDIVEYIDSGMGESDSSNNIRQIAGELEAAIKGVEYALANKEKKVVIFHDYIGICYHATGFWERKEESSKKYYEKMQSLMKKGIEIVFVKVDSHTGDLFNELADEMCKAELGITSDKVVEKWLCKDIIYVANEKVREQIICIAPKGEINIVLKENENKKVSEEKEDYTIDLVKEILEIVKGLPVDKQEEILDYAKYIKNK